MYFETHPDDVAVAQAMVEYFQENGYLVSETSYNQGAWRDDLARSRASVLETAYILKQIGFTILSLSDSKTHHDLIIQGADGRKHRVEVKDDSKSAETGNYAFEYAREFKYRKGKERTCLSLVEEGDIWVHRGLSPSFGKRLKPTKWEGGKQAALNLYDVIELKEFLKIDGCDSLEDMEIAFQKEFKGIIRNSNWEGGYDPYRSCLFIVPVEKIDGFGLDLLDYIRIT